MMPTTIEHTSRRTYGVETSGEPNMPELTGNTHISKSRECTCNTLQIVVLVTRQARAVEPPRRRASEPATVSGSGA